MHGWVWTIGPLFWFISKHWLKIRIEHISFFFTTCNNFTIYFKSLYSIAVFFKFLMELQNLFVFID